MARHAWTRPRRTLIALERPAVRRGAAAVLAAVLVVSGLALLVAPSPNVPTSIEQPAPTTDQPRRSAPPLAATPTAPPSTTATGTTSATAEPETTTARRPAATRAAAPATTRAATSSPAAEPDPAPPPPVEPPDVPVPEPEPEPEPEPLDCLDPMVECECDHFVHDLLLDCDPATNPEPSTEPTEEPTA